MSIPTVSSPSLRGLQLGAALVAFLTGCDGQEKVIYVEKEVEVLVGGEDDTGDAGGTTGSPTDNDGDGYFADDCDDTNPDINPGTVEVCNGIDDDCDGTIDDVATPPSWYPDGDGDGFGVNAGGRVQSCDAPEGYAAAAGDCDDNNAVVYPGAPRNICEPGFDADCDGVVDYEDSDSDGFLACNDCDDSSAAVHPDAEEVCNEVDDDCDGVVDGGTATGASDWYADTDQDGFGDPLTALSDCSAPDGYVDNALDCNDSTDRAYPGAEEVCDGLDNDCDSVVDGATASDASTYYRDADADGHGDPTDSVADCSLPSGYVTLSDDCDDTDALTFPGSTEVCGGGDEDCDGLVDDADPSVTGRSTWYADTDADTYGDAAVSITTCAAGSGYVADATDCDDTDTSVHPGATEMCDDVDNNCDGTIDESTAADARPWYLDNDGDNWGVSTTTIACDWPRGYAAVSGDCDDTDASISPVATETWYDGVDSDCGGDSDYDADADGYDSDAYGGTDCLDTDASAHPGATDTWYDGVDTDCAGNSDYDADADGYDSDSYGGLDCNDGVAAIHPAAAETWYDGVDSDCDDRSDYDADYDGFDSSSYSGSDCDDADELIHPYAWEDDADGIDNDCDGGLDTADSDYALDLGLGDEDDGMLRLTITSGYSFPYCGTTYTEFYLNGNGLITFDRSTDEYIESSTKFTGQFAPAIAVYWDDFDLSASNRSDAYGIVYSDAVGIYFRNAKEFLGTTTNDFAVILFDDGRVMWDFGSMSASDGLVGWSCGASIGDEVDWSDERIYGVAGLPTVGSGTEDAMWQLFTSGDPNDLGESTLWSCATAGDDLDGDGWTDLCGDPDDSDATVTP